MGYLILGGSLVVVFGGIAKALYLLAEAKIFEVVLWTITLALFVLFQVLLHKLK